MKPFIQKLPYPVTGLMLALATLGNVLGGYHSSLKLLCGSISALLLVLVLTKVLYSPKSFTEALNHPIVGSVLCTLPMGCMVLSTYMKPFIPQTAFWFWGVSIALHMGLLIRFSLRFIVKLDLPKVFPSYFIVYVGFVVASVTAPAFAQQQVGQILFWFGLINLVVLLPIVSRRVVTLGIAKPPAQPTLMIYSAPASLCLAGYMSSFADKNMAIVMGLTTLSVFLFAYALTQLPKLLKLPFFPSYSAFTFPLVITGVAFKKSFGFIMKTTDSYAFLGLLSEGVVLFSALITFYVLARYVQYVFQPVQQPAMRKAQ